MTISLPTRIVLFCRLITVNFDCSIASEEHVIKVIPAGMATAVDTGGFEGSYCTSLISHVLDFHLTEMKSDGFIEKAWKNHINKIGTIQCLERAGPDAGGGFEDRFSLGLNDVGGIFILHAILASAAIILAIYQFRQRPEHQKRTYKTVWDVLRESKKSPVSETTSNLDELPSMTFGGQIVPHH